LLELFSFENVIYIYIDIWLCQSGPQGPLPPVLLEKEDDMWIIYLVVGLVGLVFGVLCLTGLETEA